MNKPANQNRIQPNRRREGATLNARRSIAIVTGLAVGAALMASGCGTNPEPTSVVCTDFRAGADLSKSTFGVTGDLQRSYGAFAQAASDLAAVASHMLHEVSGACSGLAVELGANPADPRIAGKSEPDAAREWCKIAAERVANVRPRLDRLHFALQVITPQCTTDTSFQVACEQKCVAQAGCTEASTEERCPRDAREGVCAGTCTGKCIGAETAPASCTGTCNGACVGTCGAVADDAMDCTGGCTCSSVCTGTCTGDCALRDAGDHCDAICAGTCSEAMLAQTCTKPLAAPKCSGDVDCQKSCSASGAARAACPDGSFAIIVDPGARSDKEVARILGAFERHLPVVFLAARGRAKVLADGASDLLDSAGHILNHSQELGAMGAACGMLIGQTGDDARKSLNAALDGSQDLAHALGNSAPPASK